MPEDSTAGRIAAAALHILETEGAKAVSMRRVAKVVGITPMAIYHHFPNRQELLQSVTDREFEKLADRMPARKRKGPLEQQLMKVMDYYLDYALTSPEIFEFVFSQTRLDARRFPRDFRARRSPTMNRVADTVSDAMNAGIITKDDVWEISLGLWAHIHGYIALYRAGRFELSEKEFRLLCRRSFRRFINGLKS